MTTTVVLFVAAGAAAVGDWAAVWSRLFRVEYLLKPLALLLLAAAAATATIGPPKPWLLAGLLLGLAGDIALLAAKPQGADTAFRAGMGAFALAHIAYIAAFVTHGLRGLDVAAGALVALGVAGFFLPQVLPAARRDGGGPLVGALTGYSAILGAMAVLAVGTSSVATAIGGVLFLVSDGLLARERFTARTRLGPLAVIVTYHVAQALIVVGLVRHY